jgi:hypothetical protein
MAEQEPPPPAKFDDDHWEETPAAGKRTSAVASLIWSSWSWCPFGEIFKVLSIFFCWLNNFAG